MTDHDGKYPMAWHHPNCEDFKLEPFVRIECDGQYCVMEPNDATAFMIDAEDPDQYTEKSISLTRDQFESLPEFDGF